MFFQRVQKAKLNCKLTVDLNCVYCPLFHKLLVMAGRGLPRVPEETNSVDVLKVQTKTFEI